MNKKNNNIMIKLPKCHVSTIFTCFTSLWPKKQKKTPYTPFIHIKGKKKSHAQCYPMFNQKLHNQKLRSKVTAFGGRERAKILRR